MWWLWLVVVLLIGHPLVVAGSRDISGSKRITPLIIASSVTFAKQKASVLASRKDSSTDRKDESLPRIGPSRSLGCQRCIDFEADYVAKLAKQTRLSNFIQHSLQYCSQIFCSVVFGVILKVLNRFHVHREKILHDLVYRRPTGQPLLTVCNHQSMLDDPGIWAVALPMLRTWPSRLRWSVCTEDVFFAVSRCHCYWSESAINQMFSILF
jgi:hypothetical protein